MTASTTLKKRVWLTFILVAFVGVSILNYQFINFDNIPSLRQVTKKTMNLFSQGKLKTALSRAYPAANKKILLKNSSKSIGNTSK